MGSVMEMILDSDWVELGKYTEQQAADKIKEKIGAKKSEIVAAMNAGYDSDDVTP